MKNRFVRSIIVMTVQENRDAKIEHALLLFFFDAEKFLPRSIKHNHISALEKIEKLREFDVWEILPLKEPMTSLWVISRISGWWHNSNYARYTFNPWHLKKILKLPIYCVTGSHQDITENLKKDGKGCLFLRHDSGNADQNINFIFLTSLKFLLLKRLLRW